VRVGPENSTDKVIDSGKKFKKLLPLPRSHKSHRLFYGRFGHKTDGAIYG